MSSFQPLVPLWLPKGQIKGLDVMSGRPVLMNFDTTTSSVRGEVVGLTPTRAHIHLDKTFMLFNKVMARARFRANNIVYSLSGAAMPRERREGITLVFDDVTRTNMDLLEQLGYVSEHDEQPESSEDGITKPVVRRKRTKEQQRIVYRIPPPGGIERRENYRYDLETFAVLHVLEGNITLHCTLLEVSMTGCRLFSELPYTLDEQIEVEVQFNAKGCPFRLHGTVHLKKEQEHILGLHFTRFSGRKKEQLRELIEELRSTQQEQRV